MAGPAPDDFDIAFGLAVARARVERDEEMSVTALANKAEISRKSLMQIEAGERPARLGEADALACALDVPLESLLGLGLDGTSDAKLRALAAKIEKEHADLTAKIQDAERAIENTTRIANSYRGTRALMHANWLKVMAAMEKRGL